MNIPEITLPDETLEAIAAVLSLPEPDGFFVSHDTMPRQCVDGKPCISGIETPDGTSDAGEPTTFEQFNTSADGRAFIKSLPVVDAPTLIDIGANGRREAVAI